ncbi:MAG: beta-propeller fold lactonase family protein, partial [Acidobacteriota bacterium]
MQSRPTRRQILRSFPPLPFALRAVAGALESTNPSDPTWLLLGTDTPKGIFRARWNAERGELSEIQAVAATDHPTYLAMHPRYPILYAVNEVPV